ncbi:MAG: hypothetical protein AAF845_06420 [Bacteroidota bacterium]
MRVSTLALAFVLTACADPAPTPAPEASTPTDVAVQPPTTLDPTPADTASGTAEAPEVIDAPTASVPPAPEPNTEPAPEPPVSDALLPRPRPMPPAVPIDDPADDAARTEAAEAFWASFRAAIRAGDQAGMLAGLADVVTVGEVEYRRDSPQVQSVVEQIVENAHVRDAYVAAERLVHGPDESAFSSVARVETPEGDVTEARISGAVREVAPGDWRLVRLRTDPVEA